MSGRAIRIAPSLLAADFARLGEEVAAAEAAGADFIHFDVMDGSFVPAISFGPDVIAGAMRGRKAAMDVHLMVANPAAQTDMLKDLRPRVVTFHLEAVSRPLQVIERIRSIGALAGAAIKPATPAGGLIELLGDIDLALVMTVEPGKGGQPFMRAMLPKIAEVAAGIRRSGRNLMLEVDGGIGPANIALAAEAGADTFVVGTAAFRAELGISSAITDLRRLARESRPS